MVNLISQTKLDRLNIDTVERAIVLSALALRTAIVGSNNTNTTNNKVKITTEEKGINEVRLKLDILLPFDAYRFTQLGGIMLYAITAFNVPVVNLENSLYLDVTPSVEVSPVIPDYPSSLKTFESYLYYYASILYGSLETNRNQVVRITPKSENFDGSEVRLQIYLPLDAKKWSLGNNLVESVARVTDSYLDTSEFNLSVSSLSILTQSTLLTNNALLVN